jgi:hypothetical protein
VSWAASKQAEAMAVAMSFFMAAIDNTPSPRRNQLLPADPFHLYELLDGVPTFRSPGFVRRQVAADDVGTGPRSCRTEILASAQVVFRIGFFGWPK